MYVSSIFLMYFTGQVRWFVLNGIMGLCMIWIFHESGMDKRWIVFSTHSVGYVLLAAVVVIMILVFGGVVLVWTHLIDFVKEILTKYPQVKEDLYHERVLEQVLIRYLSDMPNISLVSLNARASTGDEESGAPTEGLLEGRSAGDLSMSSLSSLDSSPPRSDISNHSHTPAPLAKVIPNTKRRSGCYFCQREHPPFLLQVCQGWAHDGQGGGIPMCTPYAQAAQRNIDLQCQLQDKEKVVSSLQEEVSRLEVERDSCLKNIIKMKRLLSDMEGTLAEAQRDKEKSLSQERHQRNMDMERIISQHNRQLSELKRLHKLSVAAERKRCLTAPIAAESTASATASVPTEPVAESSRQGVQASLEENSGTAAVVPSSGGGAVEGRRGEGSRRRSVNSDYVMKGGSGSTVVSSTGSSGTMASSTMPSTERDHGVEKSQLMYSDTGTTVVESYPANVLVSPESAICRELLNDLQGLEEPLNRTPEDDDFNRYFLSSMNDIENMRIAIAASHGLAEWGGSDVGGDEAASSSSGRMKYARQLA